MKSPAVTLLAAPLLAAVALLFSGAAVCQPLTDAQVEFIAAPPADLDLSWHDVRLKGIYDADTQTFDFLLGLDVVLRDQTVRLWGIDAWELRGPERPKGIEALAFAKGLLFKEEGERLTPRPILVRMREDRQGRDDRGKYGRWLVEVFVQRVVRPPFTDRGGEEQPARVEWVNLNKALVDAGHAEIVDY